MSGFGCPGLTDLRAAEMRDAGARPVDGTAAFDQVAEAAGLSAFWKLIESGHRLEIVLVDEWSSGFLRGFTPLPANRSRLRLIVTSGPERAIEATILESHPQTAERHVASAASAAAIRFGIEAQQQAYYENPQENGRRSGDDARDVKIDYGRIPSVIGSLMWNSPLGKFSIFIREPLITTTNAPSADSSSLSGRSLRTASSSRIRCTRSQSQARGDCRRPV